MTTAPSELEELRTSLRRALRTPPPDVAPILEPQWRSGWPALAELGLGALCVGEDAGGFGLHVPAAAVAATELGGVLHAGPFAAATAATVLLDRSTERDVHAGVVEAIATGATVATLVVLDHGTITGAGTHVTLDGAATLLAAGDAVDHFIVVSPDLTTVASVRVADCQLHRARAAST